MNILFYSSMIFITNILFALYYKYNIYAVLFISLTISSLILHNNNYNNIELVLLDKINIYLVVIYGAYIFYNKSNKNDIIINANIVITFLLCLYLYYYGYLTNQFAFDKRKNLGNKYHALLHLIASFGHTCIILL